MQINANRPSTEELRIKGCALFLNIVLVVGLPIQMHLGSDGQGKKENLFVGTN